MPPGLNTSRLFSQLLNTGLQTKNNALYQVIYSLIGAIVALENVTSGASSGGGGSTNNIVNNITNVIADLGSSESGNGTFSDIIIPGNVGPVGPQGQMGPPGLDADEAEPFYVILSP